MRRTRLLLMIALAAIALVACGCQATLQRAVDAGVERVKGWTREHVARALESKEDQWRRDRDRDLRELGLKLDEATTGEKLRENALTVLKEHARRGREDVRAGVPIDQVLMDRGPAAANTILLMFLLYYGRKAKNILANGSGDAPAGRARSGPK